MTPGRSTDARLAPLWQTIYVMILLDKHCHALIMDHEALEGGYA